MSAGGIVLGPFPVVGTAVEAEAFRRATGAASRGCDLPLTFPTRWLVMPAIRAALADLVAGADVVLVHESQSFAYVHPLQSDTPYLLSLVVRRESGPDRLFAEGVIVSGDGVEQAHVEAVLRLIAAPKEQAA